MLIVFGGLPATGKTAISQALALRLSAVHLRIDIIEQAIREARLESRDEGGDVGIGGYVVANALAEANLKGGHTVIADCVNPNAECRGAWRQIAARAGVRQVEIEIICSDAAEHRRRVETRTGDIAGLRLPTWQEVVDREYEPWIGTQMVIDTARVGLEDAVEMIARAIE